MQAQVVLIIDSRQELSQKYKKIIQQDSYVYPVISHDLNEALEKISILEPDLIIIADNQNIDINSVCEQIREATNQYRPVILVLSKSDYLEDKLNALRAGADDYLSEPIDPAEFSIRIFAHLRRHVEELSNPTTKLPGTNMTYQVIKRNLSINNQWALMYIDIDNFEPYKEIYGYLAADKMLKTYVAILKSVISEGDYLGNIRDDKFVILTLSDKADKMAIYLNYVFDSISSKFYTEKDTTRGYLILNGDDKAGARISLVSTSIGIVSNQCRKFETYHEVMNYVINFHKLAKSQPGSSWVSDRAQICCDNCFIESAKKRKNILIVETDAALAYLLTTTLEMQGYNVDTVNTPEEIAAQINKTPHPDLILLDARGKKPEKDLAICTSIKNNTTTSNIKIIISTIIHDKEKVLNAGADLYLPKPYELIPLFGWIDKLLD